MQYYFDNAATTFPKPECVVDAMTRCLREGAVNAGRGVYDLAFEADQLITQTRQKVKALLGCTKGQIVFAPSATIALNQGILGLEWKPGQRVYTTPYEHNSVARVVHHVSTEYGVEWSKLPFDVTSLSFDLNRIEEVFFRRPPTVVVLSHVSNVFGVVTPIEDIAALAKKYSAIVIIDGAQAAPLLKIEREDLIDFYVFSGHKTFYGPFGIAGAWIRGSKPIIPILFGGTGSHSEQMDMPQDVPFTVEVGSQNIVAVAGLHAACDWVASIGVDAILKHERDLVRRFTSGLKQIHGVKYWFNQNSPHAGICSFIIKGLPPQQVGMMMNQQFNTAVRTGLHCAPQAHELLATLSSGGTVRVGFGWFNTEKEVEILLDAVDAISDY